MAKRGASSQITREGGDEAVSEDEEVEKTEAAPPVERRAIRGLPQRKMANTGLASPSANVASSTPPPSIANFGAASFGAPPANPFGGIASSGFTFGSTPSSSPAAASSGEAKAVGNPSSNPFGAAPSNPFSSIPVPGAPKPAAATPFSFGSAPVASPAISSPSGASKSASSPFTFGSAAAAPAPKPVTTPSLFSFGSDGGTPPAPASSTPAASSLFSFGSAAKPPPLSTNPSSMAVPPVASSTALPWSTTPTLPGDKEPGAAPTSLDADRGGPVVGEDKLKADDGESTRSQAAPSMTGGFTFSSSKPAAAPAPPPAAPATLPWGSTPILPGDKAGDAPKSLVQSKGGPVLGEDKASDADTIAADAVSVVAQPATTPAVEKEASIFGGRPAMNGIKMTSSASTASSSMLPPPFPSVAASSFAVNGSLGDESSSASSTEYFMNLRGLNVSLLSLLDSLVAKDPFLDLSRTLSDLASGYKSKRAELSGTTAASAPQLAQSSKSSPSNASTAPVPPSSKVAAALEPPKMPVFASTGGFTFGGKKVEASAGNPPAAAPSVGGFTPSGGGGGFIFGGVKLATSGGDQPEKDKSPTLAKPAAGFSFSPSPSVTPASPALGFSISPAPVANKEPSTKAITGSSAGAFLSSVLATPPAPMPAAEKSTASEAPKSGGLFGSSPSASASPSSASAPFSFSSTATSPAAPVQPPSFNRLPSGTPNFSFGGAPKRSVSSSSFDFGSGALSSTAPPLAAVTAPTTAAVTEQEEDVPAPTIPSDPTLLEKGEGEEDEETHFEAKANIHRMGEDNKWSKVGTGIVKVKSGGGSGPKGRVLARVEGTGKLLINFAVHSELKPSMSNVKSLLLLGFEGTTARRFLIQVKDATLAKAFKAALDERVAAIPT